MDINSWPRHQLRAQGRLRWDPRVGYRKTGVLAVVAHAPAQRTDKSDARTRSAHLLNFLSKTAAQAEREFFQHAAVPDFALVKSSVKSGIDVNDLVARKRRSMLPTEVAIAAALTQEVAAEGLLGKLADTIAEQASSATCTVTTNAFFGRANELPQIAEHNHDVQRDHEVERDHDFAIVIGGNERSIVTGTIVNDIAREVEESTDDDDDYDSIDPSLESADSILAPLNGHSNCAIELNEWFNCLFDTTDGDSEFSIDFLSESPRSQATLLPAALPPAEPLIDTDTGVDATALRLESLLSVEPAAAERTGTIRGAFALRGGHLESASGVTLRLRGAKTRRDRGRLFKRLVIDQPRIASLPSGERIERFDNGAELRKDALGRVRHIRSGMGVAIAVAYDSEGQPQGFVRSDSNGQMHSVAERDRHGVVVRDVEGRVRAAGESMCVDPGGCLSVRRTDGQFWSLDLVKQLHIERRSIVDREGVWNFLTAVFASDGFRMMTRFQSLYSEDMSASDRYHWLAGKSTGTFRFYGRDGSVIQFEGEDHLTQSKPQNVWAPGSRAIDPNFRGHHQAGTAWDSVQEYVTSYLSA